MSCETLQYFIRLIIVISPKVCTYSRNVELLSRRAISTLLGIIFPVKVLPLTITFGCQVLVLGVRHGFMSSDDSFPASDTS